MKSGTIRSSLAVTGLMVALTAIPPFAAAAEGPGIPCPCGPGTCSTAPGAKKAPGSPCCGEADASGAVALKQVLHLGPTDVADGTELQRYFERIGPDAALWYQHVHTLASPAFEGRAPGTRGIERAADYIEFYFREYGLAPPFAMEQGRPAGAKPAKAGYRQSLTVDDSASCCATACSLTKGILEVAPLKRPSKPIVTENVAGALPGKGRLKDEWIVIGGHYDHVGRGPGCSQPSEGSGVLLGADDNASGTAAVLMLAKRLAQAYAAAQPDADLRSILFIAFTGEERGLVGSRHFVRNPHAPLDKIRAMLNFDMVGRLREDRLWVSGFGTAAEFPSVLGSLLEASGLKVVTDAGSDASDQVSFLEAGIPSLYVMTGGHDEIHTPADVASRLNPAGAAKVLDLAEKVAMRLSAHARPLTYVEQPAPATSCCSGNRLAGANGKAPPQGCCVPRRTTTQ